MKSLLMLCALLGLTASSYYPGLYAGAGHWGHGAAHIVIGPHGVPIETPEVASLKAAHAAWHVDSASRAAHSPDLSYGYVTPYAHGYATPYALGYATPYAHGHLPQPVHDTPEVAAAKVAHFAAHAAAAHHGRKKRSYGAYGAGYLAYGAGHGAYGYGHLPQQVHDTPEVAAAKVAHAHAYSQAASRAAASPDYSSGHYSGAYHGGAYDDGQYRGEGAVAHYAPAAYHGGAYDDGQYRVGAHEDGSYHGEGAYHGDGAYHGGAYDDGQYRGEGAYNGGYHGGYHGPAAHIVIGPGGVPLDTPEVAHARAAHLAEKAKVSGHYGHHY